MLSDLSKDLFLFYSCLQIRTCNMGGWPEKGIRSSGARVTGSDDELSCECWESSPGPLEEQSKILTVGK